MTPALHAKSDIAALLGGLTYILRRVCRYRGNRMLDGMEWDEAIALARWMDSFPIEPDEIVEVDYRTRPWYESANGIMKP